jgi:hypothetical protein
VITGTLKSQIDRVWDSFWSGGISNPVEVIEQITYLLPGVPVVAQLQGSTRLGSR